jgi:hypothetical protein
MMPTRQKKVQFPIDGPTIESNTSSSSSSSSSFSLIRDGAKSDTDSKYRASTSVVSSKSATPSSRSVPSAWMSPNSLASAKVTCAVVTPKGLKEWMYRIIRGCLFGGENNVSIYWGRLYVIRYTGIWEIGLGDILRGHDWRIYWGDHKAYSNRETEQKNEIVYNTDDVKTFTLYYISLSCYRPVAVAIRTAIAKTHLPYVCFVSHCFTTRNSNLFLIHHDNNGVGKFLS